MVQQNLTRLKGGPDHHYHYHYVVSKSFAVSFETSRTRKEFILFSFDTHVPLAAKVAIPEPASRGFRDLHATIMDGNIE